MTVGQAQVESVGNAAPSHAEQQLKGHIVDALAQVRAMSVDELSREVAAGGGDCRVDSKEAEVVIVILERLFNRRLAQIEDLEPEEINSIAALTGLIGSRLSSDA